MSSFNKLLKIDGLPFEMPPITEPSNDELLLLFSYVSSFVVPDAALTKLRSYFGNLTDSTKFFVLGTKECFETKKLELVSKLQENRFNSLAGLKNAYASAIAEHDMFIIFAFEDLKTHFKNCAIINLAIKDWQNKLTEVLCARRQQSCKG